MLKTWLGFLSFLETWLSWCLNCEKEELLTVFRRLWNNASKHLFYSILFYSILFYSILFYSVLQSSSEPETCPCSPRPDLRCQRGSVPSVHRLPNLFFFPLEGQNWNIIVDHGPTEAPVELHCVVSQIHKMVSKCRSARCSRTVKN